MGKAIKLKPTRANFKLINNFQLIERDKVVDLLSSLGFEFANKVMITDLVLENLCLIIKPAYDVLLERDDEIGIISKEMVLFIWPEGIPQFKPPYPLDDTSADHPYLQVLHQKLIRQIESNDMVDIPLFLADRDMDFREEDRVAADFDLESILKQDGSLVIICRHSIISFEADYYPLETEDELLNELDLSLLKNPKMPIVCTFGLAH